MELSKNEEKSIINGILEKDISLKKDTEWYILSTKWFESWKLYVSNQGDHPGKIDNFDIVCDDNINLKDNLIESKDFLIVPSSGWKMLHDWYGGGPSLPRRVIIEGESKTKRVEVYPLKLTILRNGKTGLADPSSEVFVNISKKACVKDLKNFGMRLLNLDDCRVWNMFMPSNPILLDDSMDKSLDEVYIQPNQRILFETRVDGSFQMKEKKKSLTENVSSIFKGFKTSRSSKGFGLCGLSNLGNTCFMNSALQCLSNTQLLNDYFLQDLYRSHINKTNPLGTKGKLATAYAENVKKMWSGNSSVSPVELKYIIGQYATQFNGYRQHDSQELLAFLLDGLHEDLNRITKKPYVELKEGNGKDDDIIAKGAWEDHLRRNMSVIVETFQGQLKSTLKCPDCNKISIKFDPFMYLSLPIPSQGTNKTISVIYLPSIEEKFVKYTCNLSLTDTIGDLRTDLMSQLKIDDELIFADLNGFRIHSILIKSLSILEISPPGEKVLCFRKPKGEYIPIFVCQRVKNEETQMLKPVCIPIILFVSPKITGLQLYKLAHQHVSRYSNPQSSPDNFNLDEIRFRLKYVAQSGASCGTCTKEDCLGCEIYPGEDVLELKSFNIAIDWPSLESLNIQDAMTVTSQPNKQTVYKKGVTLLDCLWKFSEPEKLDPSNEWFCPHCKQLKQAMKTFQIWSTPDVLIIHLKRFLFSKLSGSKLTSLVDFPLEGLDVSKYLVQKSDTPILYDLFAISNHSGSLFGGHYTADCLNYLDNRWYHFNDSSVSKTDPKNLQDASAYVLFYKRRK